MLNKRYYQRCSPVLGPIYKNINSGIIKDKENNYYVKEKLRNKKRKTEKVELLKAEKSSLAMIGKIFPIKRYMN